MDTRRDGEFTASRAERSGVHGTRYDICMLSVSGTSSSGPGQIDDAAAASVHAQPSAQQSRVKQSQAPGAGRLLASRGNSATPRHATPRYAFIFGGVVMEKQIRRNDEPQAAFDCGVPSSQLGGECGVAWRGVAWRGSARAARQSLPLCVCIYIFWSRTGSIFPVDLDRAEHRMVKALDINGHAEEKQEAGGR